MADSLSVLLFNVSGKKSKKGIIYDQCTGIERVIAHTNGERNLFVFGQDKLEKNKLTTLKSSLKKTTPPHTEPPVADNKEADILQDQRQERPIETVLVQPSIPNSFIFFERLTARTAIINRQKILLVSWHAPYTGSNDYQKLGIFRELIKHVAKTKKHIGADIVILGGDFNVTLNKAAEGDRTSKVSITQTLKGRFVPDPLDENFKISKDFLVVWPRDLVEIGEGVPKILHLNEIDNFLAGYPQRETFELITQEGGRVRKCPSQKPFDHPRLLYRLRIIKSVVSDIKLLRADVLRLTEQMAALNAKMDDHMQLHDPEG